MKISHFANMENVLLFFINYLGLPRGKCELPSG
jgi:hypothetical protein